ncbi:hypothetical protein ACFL01_03045 [Planctomycetota bacterium]
MGYTQQELLNMGWAGLVHPDDVEGTNKEDAIRRSLGKALAHFQHHTGAAHAFQASFGAPFVAADCFEHHNPVRVPARTLLSQLV